MSAKDQTETDGRGRFARKRAAADAPRQRSLGSLRMVWQAGTRYPGHVALAILALFITAAATLAMPQPAAPGPAVDKTIPSSGSGK